MKLHDGDGTPDVEVAEVHSDLRVDIMYRGCWPATYEDGRPDCRDLLSEALELDRKHLTGMASFFARCSVDDEEYMLSSLDIQPSNYLKLRALRPVTVAISACPDDTLPGISPSDLVVEVIG